MLLFIHLFENQILNYSRILTRVHLVMLLYLVGQVDPHQRMLAGTEIGRYAALQLW